MSYQANEKTSLPPAPRFSGTISEVVREWAKAEETRHYFAVVLRQAARFIAHTEDPKRATEDLAYALYREVRENLPGEVEDLQGHPPAEPESRDPQGHPGQAGTAEAHPPSH